MVAPVINLSGSEVVDGVRVADSIASELNAFDSVTVIPVNLTLAAMATAGLARIESPVQARALATEFGADATIVTAVTEFDPYDPMVLSMTMQWYSVKPDAAPGYEPFAQTATRMMRDTRDAEFAPTVQVQRVFQASDKVVLDEMEEYGERRDGDESAYGWRKYAQSQELYVRYCSWSLIRSMLRVREYGTDAVDPEEADYGS
ncbi:MAG: hypothetical protein AB7N71_08125 [Phycisphaerae bacterium]